jgi:HSP20 family molecular chaperone IbpA
MYHTQVTWPSQSSAVRPHLLPEGTTGNAILPRMDIYETGDEIIYLFEMPGIDTDRLEVEIEGRNIIISAPVLTINPQYCSFRYQERTKGLMGRVITAASDADLEKVRAEMRNGLLELRFMKQSEDAPSGRRVRVNVYSSGYVQN